ncbi:MAG: TIGR04283 family arsenosugar biosynthesis glycosyltransferase [Anaerolineae bacterium]
MQLSVIIPTLNEADNIVGCLRSIRSQAADAEILVVDGGSSDNTVSRARPYAEVIAGPRGRARQMNLGGRHASGDVLLFLHADSRVHPSALAYLDQVMRDPAIVGATFTLWFDTNHYLLRFFASMTRFEGRIFRYGDQGIIARHAVFEALGGFIEAPLMDDVDFLWRMSAAGPTALIPLPVTTSARRFMKRGVVRQQSLNIALVVAWLLGAQPETLARWYYGPPAQ